MKQIKTSWALIIVFACAVIIGGGAIAWAYGWGIPNLDIGLQSPIKVSTKQAATSETAGWKTYMNEDLGFSFRYPSDWSTRNTVSEIIFSSNKSDLDSLTGKTKAKLSGNAIRLDITNEDTSKYSSDTDALSSLEGRKVTTFTKSTTTLDQKPVVKYTRTVKKGEAFAENPSVATYDTTEVVYNIINGKKLLRFWFTIDGDKYNTDLADKVFQTVKFTTAATSDQTANWKTYTNDTYGFSFKYPKTLSATPNTSTNSIGGNYAVVVNDGKGGRWTFGVDIKNTTKTLEQEVSSSKTALEESYNTVNVSTVNINGKQAKKITVSDPKTDTDYGNEDVYYVNSGILYVIHGDTSSGQITGGTNFDTFVSTFQFTK